MLKGTESILLIREIVVGEDSYGEYVMSQEIQEIKNVLVAPGNTELTSSDDEVRSKVEFTMYFPKEVDVQEKDRFEVRGSVYFLAGVSQMWNAPKRFRNKGGQVVKVSRERNY